MEIITSVRIATFDRYRILPAKKTFDGNENYGRFTQSHSLMRVHINTDNTDNTDKIIKTLGKSVAGIGRIVTYRWAGDGGSA